MGESNAEESGAAPPSGGGDPAHVKPRPGLPATLAGFEDEACFSVVLNEEQVGTMRSTWRTDGSFESRSTMSLAGQTVETTTSIAPDADGRWKTIVIHSPVGLRTITREGTSVKRHFKGSSQEQTSTFETPEGGLLFDNDSPALMSQALRLYDRAKGGVQKFPLLIGARPPVELTVGVKETTVRAFAGRDIAWTRFLYGVPGVDLFAWADESGRVYLVEVPAQNAVFVRAGYEALRRADAPDALISAPDHDVQVDRSLRVPMRDGLELVTDIYRPVGLEQAPVVLVRTPYKKELGELQARFYARRGYVFAVQDVRGRFGSPGVWEPLVNEGHDGYDTIEWLAQQPYTNGKIGMIGASYLGSVQWLAAAQRPPHLVTIIPNVSPTDPFYNVPYEHGVLLLLALWWADVLESEATADISGAALVQLGGKRYPKLLRALPVIDLDKAVLGRENPYWRQWIAHPTADSYWDRAHFLNKLENVKIPVFHQSGWFDGDGIGTKLNHAAMASHGHPHQKLILGPWGHTDTAERMVGDRDFGENAILDLQREYLRWFDRWLKGVRNGIDEEPLVRVFVMGANTWLQGATYPLEITRARKVYLTSAGHANTSKGDGRLVFDPPAADVPPDRYTYDPGDPTPDSRFREESEGDEREVRSAEERRQEADERHRRITAARNDILVYQTEILAKPLTVAGPVSAVLYASSSARDTDWFVTLAEVDERGKTNRLALGKLRARFRNSMERPELLTPGEIYEYTIDVWHTGIRIPAGSRLRVEIASAAIPLCSRNLNTGGHNEVETTYVTAEQTIHHDRRHPSHIVLPVVPD